MDPKSPANDQKESKDAETCEHKTLVFSGRRKDDPTTKYEGICTRCYMIDWYEFISGPPPIFTNAVRFNALKEKGEKNV